jgi:hypothetical protein
MTCKCPTHDCDLVEHEASTPEQAWCGTWLRCPHCAHSALILSAALQAEYEAAFQKAKAAYDALRTKKQRRQFLKHRAAWIVERLTGNTV